MDTSGVHLLPLSNLSRSNSIEFKDAIINEKWVQSANRRKGHLTPKAPEKKKGWFGGGKSEEELLMERVEQHELEELQTFIAQKLFRLSDEEAAQTSFNANYLTKARSKMVPCADYSRVKLTDGLGKLDDRNALRNGMFSSEHEFLQEEGCTLKTTYGTTNFIHANYVKGGPLLNTFICAQAPLQNTQEDFWRMVFQEKSQFIVMLNSAVDSSTLGPLDSANRNYCPYYWPRAEKEFLEFGSFRITCVSVDSKADPLFTIAKLKLQKIGGNLADDECDEELLLEHWQWDWQYLGDVHWPFRVLRKARQLSTPTIVHCTDGCSKAGTLVAIETTLMHFIRGSPITKSLILQSCVFVRLQRRLSVSSTLLYLFIYRVVLRWIEPYVTKWYERAALGLRFKSIGFIQKYTGMIQEFSRITPAY
ncbi:Protein CBR-EGG-3 [Caenorhabditis briggsae]|uniref:Protein CBR-EGG-3 n=1 Tax=Caenorhabditis briggsae TaxID=6238 RepID=A8XYA4_CAEBR|nr:Protein CBR-EGG-3 [Caenorhabditis briggsae]CAP37621.2 Protein CBR-EGG-3 [Caenorhabditis briggsae]